MESIDFTYPLYLHPSDMPGTVLVSHQLTGIENYNLWSHSIQIALLAKNMLGFIDGDCARDDFVELLQSQWDRLFASTAALVWKDLKERFSKIDGSQIFLHQEIPLFTQCDSSVSTYYSRLKLLWDEYSALILVSSCNCIDSSQALNHVLQQRLFQFLMELNEIYSAIRNQILLLDPLHLFNWAYSIVVQDESQRYLPSSVSRLSDATVMYSNSSNPLRGRFNGVCDFCKIYGHKCEQCYRLNGFPPEFKFTKAKKSSSSMVANSDQNDTHSESSPLTDPLAPMFTTDQYNRLLELLNKDVHDSGDVATANFAGMIHSGLHASKRNSITWILDTGATNHMLSSFECLSNPVACTSRFVHLPNGKTRAITHIGSYWFNSSHCLQNDLFNDKMLGIGKKQGGLYILHSFGYFLSIASKHMSLNDCKLDSSVIYSCSVCPLAKQVRLPFTISQSRSSLSFHLIHMDLWGPYKISTHSGHSQFEASIKIVRSDNGSEFFSKGCYSLYSSFGIVHQSSCVDIPHQNGVFGCLGYATVTKPRDKFFPRAIPSVFIGYSDTQKGYLMFSLVSKTFFVSRLFPSQPVILDSEFFITDLSITDVPSAHNNPSNLSSQQSQSSSSVVVRRSSRVSKPPLWLNEYVSCQSSTSSNYPISDHISYSHLPFSTQSFLSSTYIIEPTSYSDAIKDPLWVTAMQEEIQALELNNTWSVVPLSPGKVPIGCKWVYKVKFWSNGEIELYEAHLVAKGYNQRESVDFVETFSHVAKLVTVQTVLALTSLQCWPLFQMDVHNAFLQGNLLEEVYMQFPQGFYSQGENMVYRLHKSIYGLSKRLDSGT
ncbi:uncharacterized protein LOC120123099 [Hibiscus syriacus]|uniref:uncharacterized protein LOC120123099 n=1 Tax=Hibiscus syriacus TaxID=106335 RepID=UPI0019227C54|nr:uncharacterized protein LOC120123099 [Hibiscus syriacus]